MPIPQVVLPRFQALRKIRDDLERLDNTELAYILDVLYPPQEHAIDAGKTLMEVFSKEPLDGPDVNWDLW
jgi:hypothetical protein